MHCCVLLLSGLPSHVVDGIAGRWQIDNLFLKRVVRTGEFVFVDMQTGLTSWQIVIGWFCTKKGVDYSAAYAKEPHFEQAFDRPKELKLIVAPPATSFVEVYTKFSSRLVEAYTDASLLDNRTKIMQLLKEAEKEANDIIKSNGEYAE